VARHRHCPPVLPNPLDGDPGLLFRDRCILVSSKQRFHDYRMVFEILPHRKMRIGIAGPDRLRWVGRGGGCGSGAPAARGDTGACAAAGPLRRRCVATACQRPFDCSRIRCRIKLVVQRNRELLAQPVGRRRRLLRNGRSAPQPAAGGALLPVPRPAAAQAVPSSLRLLARGLFSARRSLTGQPWLRGGGRRGSQARTLRGRAPRKPVAKPYLADWGEKMNKINGHPPKVFTTRVRWRRVPAVPLAQ
jgi:hypothetical protein